MAWQHSNNFCGTRTFFFLLFALQYFKTHNEQHMRAGRVDGRMASESQMQQLSPAKMCQSGASGLLRWVHHRMLSTG